MLKNKSDGITVNGIRATVRFVLSEGDVLALNYEDADRVNKDKNFVAENWDLLPLLDIIYEDGFILAVNKPPFMPSHPSLNHFDDTLANMVAAYFRKNGVSSFFRPINRLDKNTSGIVLVAKDKIIAARLNVMMQNGGIKKTYIAAINGNVNDIYPKNLDEIGGFFEYDAISRIGRIKAPIKRERDSIIKRVCAADGAFAETEFEIIGSNGSASVAKVYPKTGRTHQIRLHFQVIGCPLIGEDLYCENLNSPDFPINRHALHAYSLEFSHPENAETITLKREPPEDMRSIINKIWNI
jgi:23S rRNA pseudouridine1911/1915/1917 synthase